jgi:hypothetical protein
MSRPPLRQPSCARGSPRTAPCAGQRWGDGDPEEGHRISCSPLRRVEEGTGGEREPPPLRLDIAPRPREEMGKKGREGSRARRRWRSEHQRREQGGGEGEWEGRWGTREGVDKDGDSVREGVRWGGVGGREVS